jgi:hypothetical protein
MKIQSAFLHLNIRKEGRKDGQRDMTFPNKEHSYGTLQLSLIDFERPQLLLSAQ